MRLAPLRVLPAVLLPLVVAACSAPPPLAGDGAVESVAAPSAPSAVAAEPDFAGLFESSYGTLRLSRTEGGYAGTYGDPPNATLAGTVLGGVLHGTYHEPVADGPGVTGRFAFVLKDAGQGFRGVWREGEGEALDPNDESARRWSGQRLVGEAGRIWFVILEENWESSLREPEYSFGAMLRAFFERVPSVGVRHRFVHDRADLERFCAQLSKLVEPVVLYISSHGSPEGLGIGADGISPEVLGGALRHVNELRLLHLGSCAVMAGDAPERIRAAAGERATFPISGFGVSVDWAASAIVDLTYMQLVLEQGMAPAEAAAAARRMLTFANPPGDSGPLPGCDLRLSLPGER